MVSKKHLEFLNERRRAAEEMGGDHELKKRSVDWMVHSDRYKYVYNFAWLGRPIIKYPQDMVVLQEIIWREKPDLIIETGIAHGGSLILSASILELLGGKRMVLGIDVDIRSHNRQEIESHPLSKRIQMIEGSSIDPKTLDQVKEIASSFEKIMVILDSNHTHDHVLQELTLYSPLVSKGHYLIVLDTIIELFPNHYYSANRPWDVGNNPMTALREFLKDNPDFRVDTEIDNKLLITEAPSGYVLRT